MSQTEIRRTYRNQHPYRKYKHAYRNGQLEDCYAQVLVGIGNGKVAISMNGTAVLTAAEFKEFSNTIFRQLDGVGADAV